MSECPFMFPRASFIARAFLQFKNKAWGEQSQKHLTPFSTVDIQEANYNTHLKVEDGGMHVEGSPELFHGNSFQTQELKDT